MYMYLCIHSFIYLLSLNSFHDSASIGSTLFSIGPNHTGVYIKYKNNIIWPFFFWSLGSCIQNPLGSKI